MRIKAVSAVLIAAIVIASMAYYELYRNGGGSKHAFSGLEITDLTKALGSTFSPGSIQAFGENNTTILISGSGQYHKPSDFSTPALMGINDLNPGTSGHNMDELANTYFHDGSVFGTAWNGTSWILTGEISFGNTDEGSAIAINEGNVVNLTPLLGPYFKNGGIWFDAWNGTGWLFGGNNDRAASLIGYYHGGIVNYTGSLGTPPHESWIQLIEWNGSSWLIGGHLIFGFLSGSSYNNLLYRSTFSNSGLYSAVFHKGKWLVGGGSPAGLEIVSGQKITENITLPVYFRQWANGITSFQGGYLVGGEASHDLRTMHPALYYLNLSNNHPSFTNLTWELPASFHNGQIQFLAHTSLGSVSGVLLAGQGNYNELTGQSTGALALIRT